MSETRVLSDEDIRAAWDDATGDSGEHFMAKFPDSLGGNFAHRIEALVLQRVAERIDEHRRLLRLDGSDCCDLAVETTLDEINAALGGREAAMGDKTRGLYGKFHVERTDGKSAPGEKHDGCEYFVLDLTHDPHAIPALAAYCISCDPEYPLLGRDLRLKLYDLRRSYLRTGGGK